jgi:diadenosine tetraphosphate (Ap4A) HIT family hydrolase
VIPRWRDDRNFPAPIWAQPVRERATSHSADRERLRAAFERILRSRGA